MYGSGKGSASSARGAAPERCSVGCTGAPVVWGGPSGRAGPSRGEARRSLYLCPRPRPAYRPPPPQAAPQAHRRCRSPEAPTASCRQIPAPVASRSRAATRRSPVPARQRRRRHRRRRRLRRWRWPTSRAAAGGLSGPPGWPAAPAASRPAATPLPARTRRPG